MATGMGEECQVCSHGVKGARAHTIRVAILVAFGREPPGIGSIVDLVALFAAFGLLRKAVA